MGFRLPPGWELLEEPLSEITQSETEPLAKQVLSKLPGAEPAAAAPAAAPKGLPVTENDRDLLTRTLMGETGTGFDDEKLAIAHVARNRARMAGTTVSDEVLKPGQFEPWMSRSRELKGYDPSSIAYQQARRIADGVLNDEMPDPTKGATYFYAPKTQRKLGRNAPEWDDGSGVDISRHRFFRHAYGGKEPGEVGDTKGLPKGWTLADPGMDMAEEAPGVTKVSAKPKMPEGWSIVDEPAAAIEEPEAEPSKPNAFMRGLVGGSAEQNPDLTAEFLDGMADLGPEGISGSLRGGAEWLRGVGKAPEGYKMTGTSLFDSKDFDEALTWAGESLGQGLSSTLPSLVLGGAGAAAGGAVAGPPGAIGGGLAGAVAPSFALNYGETRKALREAGVKDADASQYSLYAAVPMAALDTVTPAGVIAKLGGLQAVKREVARGIARRIAAGGAKGFTQEGVTEAAQEAIKDLTISQATGQEFLTPENMKGIAESFLAGGLTGGVLGGSAGVVRDQVKPAAAPPVDAEAPQLALPNVMHMPDQSMGPQTADAPPAVTPEFATRALGILRAAGYSDEDIQGMDPLEMADAVQEAEDQGITPQAPIAQDWLSAPGLEEGKGQFPAPDLQSKINELKAPLPDVGGVRDQLDARKRQARIDALEPPKRTPEPIKLPEGWSVVDEPTSLQDAPTQATQPETNRAEPVAADSAPSVAPTDATGDATAPQLLPEKAGKRKPPPPLSLTAEESGSESQPGLPLGVAPKPAAKRAYIEEDSVKPEKITNPVKGTEQQKLAQIIKLTKDNVPLVQKAVDAVNARLGTKGNLNVKEPDTILEKANRPGVLENKPWFRIEHVRDTLRFKTVLSHYNQVGPALEEVMKAGFKVVKIDTAKLFEPKEWGWPITAFDLRAPNGQLVEWYLHPTELDSEALGSEPHKLFEKWRNESKDSVKARWDEYMADVRKVRAVYQGAFKASLKRMGYADEAAAKADWETLSASFPSIAEKFSFKSPGITTASEPKTQEPAPSESAKKPSPETSSRPESLSTQTTNDVAGVSTPKDITTEPGESKDDLADALDAAISERETKAEVVEHPKAHRRLKGELAKGAVKHAGKGAKSAVEGLAELFGGKKVSSGLSFDEETWARAKPLFIKASQEFGLGAKDATRLAKLLVDELIDNYGFTTAQVKNMRVYLLRFLREVRDGIISLDKQDGTLEERLATALRKGELRDRIALMKFLKDTEGEALSSKEKEELVEVALVRAARQIIAEGMSEIETFKSLVKLYEGQPRLSTRTSTSVSEQAYSTPLPLAYIASRLAGVKDANRVYEPTAGNGALLIEATPESAVANELNASRAAALKAQGFETTQEDATKFQPKGKFDAIIMNPPFGAVREGGETLRWDIPVGPAGLTHKTGQIDHAIAIQGLRAMKDDGRAVLILGGVKARNHEEMRKGYRGEAKRNFFFQLYNNYNVVDHFQVDGDLYERQGAGWPVDVVVIEGKGKSKRALPAANPPTILESWDALEHKLTHAPEAEPSHGSEASVPASSPVGRPGEGSLDSGKDAVGQRPVERDGPGESERLPIRGLPDNAEPAPVRTLPTDQESVGVRGPVGERGEPRRKADTGPRQVNESGQVPNKPKAKLPDSGTVLPQNLVTPTEAALDRVEDAHGDIIDFVARESGFSRESIVKSGTYAEIIDGAAAMIHQLKQGNGFILGDQTGIGKTRQLIFAIGWAIKQGHKPIIVTDKLDLYADLLNEMDTIDASQIFGGRKPRPFMTNDQDVPVDEEAIEWQTAVDNAKDNKQKKPERRGRFLKALNKKDYDAGLQALAAGTSNYDFVLTTYSQLQTVKGGAETARRHLMRAMAPKAMFILDETHNAGGEGVKAEDDRFKNYGKNKAPGRAAFIRQIIKDAPGVVYSSATYAKRPEVMDLFFRTDIGKAVDNIEKLPGLIKRGGVPMQQVVAAMLAQAGQYMRRERSFDGVEYKDETVAIRPDGYAQMAKTIRAIFKFDLQAKTLREDLQEQLDEHAGMLAGDHAVGGAGATSTNFASVMHNVVAQMLLAIKADAVADRAIQSFKDGEKPIIGLHNTMETFLNNFAEQEGIKIGDTINITFGDLLKRYLARTLKVTENKPGGASVEHIIDPANMPPEMQRMYREALDLIDSGDYSALPVSPIDHMRKRMADAGMVVTEITGRDVMIDYKTGQLVHRPKGEQGVAGKQRTKFGFRTGKIDALIINSSGAVGISLHASKDSDLKRRRMIIAQAAPNIDTHMQMLGRIHRTGQVVLPAYSQLAADIPAEARPAAVLMKKMASLNANTTASRKSAVSVDAIDFVNEVGDEVVETIMDNDPMLERELGNPLPAAGKKNANRQLDAAKKVTGRIMLLEPQQQEALINLIQDNYKLRLQELEALGESPLEAKTVDLQAKQLEVTEIKPRTGESPFQDGVYLEKVSAKAQGRAMSIAEIEDEIGKNLQSKGTLAELSRIGQERTQQETSNIAEIGRKYIAEQVAGVKAETQVGVRKRLDAELDRWLRTRRPLHPGARVTLKLPEGDTVAVVLEVKRSGKAAMPFAAGSWRAKFAVPDGARTMDFSFTSLFPEGIAKGPEERGVEFERSWVRPEEIGPKFEEARKEGRENRFIFTGNILAGFEAANGLGRIVNFTDEHGDVKPGIYMPRGFDLAKFKKDRKVRFKNGTQIRQFLQKAPEGTAAVSSDDFVTLRRNWRGWSIETDAGRAKGGRYYTDPAVREALDGKEFVRRSGAMRVEGLSEAEFIKVVDAMQTIGASFETKQQQEIADEVVKGEPSHAAMAEYKMKPRFGKIGGQYVEFDEEMSDAMAEGKQVDPRTLGRPKLRFGENAEQTFRELAREAVRKNKERLEAEVEEALLLIRRMAGPIEVKTPQYLSPAIGAEFGVHHTEIHGLHSYYEKTPSLSYITLALGNQARMRGKFGGIAVVASHEAWHHIEFALLNDRELAVLARNKEAIMDYAIPEIERSQFQGNKMSPADKAAYPPVEYTAMAFQRYRREMESPHDEGARRQIAANGLHIGVRQIFQRIMMAMAKLRRGLRKYQIETYEDLFDMAMAGEFADRTPVSRPSRNFAWPKLSATADKPIAQTKTPAFKAWFEGSKVVDPKGKPLRAYHGTTKDFDAFKTMKGTATTNVANMAWAGDVGSWFTAPSKFDGNYDEENAEYMAGSFTEGKDGQYKDGAMVLPVYLRIRRPKEYQDHEEFMDDFARNRNGVDFQRRLITEGHDGLVIRNSDTDGHVDRDDWVAFYPKQIKSATGNSGAFDPGNPSISAAVATMPSSGPAVARVAAAARGAATTRTIWSRAGGKIDKARVKLQDKMLPFKRLEQQLGIPINLSTYLASRLYPGKTGERLEDLKADFIEPMMAVLRKGEITSEQFSDYLQARHTRERNRVIKSRDPSNPNGAGRSDAEAAVILSEVRNGGKQNVYDEAAAIHDRMNGERLKNLLKGGLIDRATFDNWSSTYSYYTPLRGFEVESEEDGDVRGNTGRGFDVRGPESHMAFGRHSHADNSLAYAVLQAQSAIIRAEKNRVDRTLLRAVEAHPSPNFWNVYKGEYKRRINPGTGLVESYFVPPAFVHQDNIFGVKIGGKMKYVELKNARLAKSLRGVGASIQNPILRGMMATARVFAALQTQWNPNFALTNPIKDLQTALLNLSDVADLPAGVRTQIVKDAMSIKSIRGILSAIRGQGTSEYAPWFDEFRRAGGKISFIESNSVDRIKKNLNNLINEGRLRRGTRMLGQFIADLNTAAENSVRLSTYIAMRKAGISKDRAAFVARDMTVDFNMHGEWGPAINSMYIFFNASLQGSVRMAGAVARSKKLQAALVTIAAAGFGLDFLNSLLAGDDDDDGKNDYDEIPDFIKERNIIVMLGKGKGYLTFPLAWGYNVPYLAGQQLGSVARGARKPLEAAGTTATALLDSFNPMGSMSSIWQYLSPTFIDPGIQTLENKTWYGGPIYPTKFDQNKPDSETYFQSAPDWAVETSRILNSATGGNRGRSGTIDISPETIEHYFNFATGGTGRFVFNAYKTGSDLVKGKEFLPEDTPLLQRFYAKRTTETDRRDFYQTWDEVDAAKYEVRTLTKQGDAAGAKEAMQTYKAELSVWGMFDKTKDAIKDMKDLRVRIENDERITKETRDRKLEELAKREREMIARAIATYTKAKKGQ